MSLIERMPKKGSDKKRASCRASHAEDVKDALAPAVSATTEGGLPRSTTNREIVIRDDMLKAAQMLPPREDREMLNDDFNHVRRSLVANATGRNGVHVEDGNLIAVTSAMPGEGKTFSSIQLAFSVVRDQDMAALLVDADLAKCDLSSVFGAENELGLTDLLSDPLLSPADILMPTSVPNLWFLPAGTKRRAWSDLLSTCAMEELLSTLGAFGTNVITICDTGPSLVAREAALISSYCGQVLMVVKAGKTLRDTVMDALDIVDTDQNKAISLVLNEADAVPYPAYGLANTERMDEHQ